MFQEYALFPHMTVRANIAFGGRRRVDDLLERFRISHLADERPPAISGGERQRVALARAIAREPAVLLLDEPLAALDAHTRTVVRAELQDLLTELPIPALLVTHDFRDATALADRIGVILDGRLLQLGTPQELIARPATPSWRHSRAETCYPARRGHCPAAAAKSGSKAATWSAPTSPPRATSESPSTRGRSASPRRRRRTARCASTRSPARSTDSHPREGGSDCASASSPRSARPRRPTRLALADGQRVYATFTPADTRLVR